MRCDEARRLLWPDPEHPDAEALKARLAAEHLAVCPSCQGFFRLERALTQRLSQLERAAGCPEPVRVATRAALEARISGGRARFLAWGAGTLAAAAALVLLAGTPSPMPPSVGMPLVAHARAGLAEGEAILSSDMAEVERWLAQRAGQGIRLPPITDATLMGGRVIHLGTVRAAVAFYSLHGAPLAYFVLPSREIMGRRVGSNVSGASMDGYELALWTERGHARAVVAPMPKKDVMAIAKECRSLAGLGFLHAYQDIAVLDLHLVTGQGLGRR